MKFKDSKDIDDFEKINPKLRLIILDLDEFSIANFKEEIVVTSLIRKDNKNSVHYYGRGCDVRSKKYTDIEKNEIVSYLNNKYRYGLLNRKKVCLLHDVGKGEHFHIQVSWR